MKKRLLFSIFVVISLIVASYFLGWFKSDQIQANISAPSEKVEKPKEEVKPEAKIVFVGDMMFDRGVEQLMKSISFTYPVELIKDFLSSFDYAVGNLEGPINENPKEFPDESLQFSFDKKSVESLKAGNFKLVSLANNHTLNMKKEGLEETKKILKENNIDYVGDTIGCGIEYLYQKDTYSFYAINETFPSNCSDSEVADAISDIKFYNPESFLVVMIHWGDEYKMVNSDAEQDLAHEMIDLGADVIIGGHPHVVQNIEKYKDKIIFYSLGNFIFDQYFSKETKEGLVVGMEDYKDKIVYNLYPVENKLAQPRLMEGEQKQSFLDDLASRSADDLKESIKNGSIEIKK